MQAHSPKEPPNHAGAPSRAPAPPFFPSARARALDSETGGDGRFSDVDRLHGQTPLWPRVLAAFLVTALLYFAGFAVLEHLRERRGPWEVTFTSGTNGMPRLEVRQPHLGIEGVVVEFPGGVTPAGFRKRTVRFSTPETKEDAPLGEVLFLDTTFLPGTVTMELFGHQVELLPRVLIVDHQERAWESDLRLTLPARLPWRPPDTP